MPLKLAEYIPLVFLCALLCVLVARRSFRSFPWFTAYVFFAVCAGIARFFVRNRPPDYFYTYWITEGGYALLGICVMYEAFKRVFGNLGRSGWPRLVFPIMVVLSAVLTYGRVSAFPMGLHMHNHLINAIILGEIAVRFLECLIFATLVTLVPIVGLQWRQYPFGVAMGFGIYSTTALLTTIRFSILGLEYHFFWGWALIVSYTCAVLIWLWFFSAKEKPSPPGTINPTLAFEELKAYRSILRRIHKR